MAYSARPPPVAPLSGSASGAERSEAAKAFLGFLWISRISWDFLGFLFILIGFPKDSIRISRIS